jgi:CheY-like chemotaxis protein
MSAVVGAGFIAYRELNENTKSRHLEVADRLFTELNAPENVQARRWVFQNLPADPVQGLTSLSSEGRDHVKKVLNSLDRVAFLTQPDWIPTDMMMPWMSPMVVKAWEKLQPYVDYESQRRHEPDYYRSVRELAARCLAWRQQNLGEAPTVWVPDAL